MAIEEHDREDLLRDGRTMAVRGELVLDGVTIVIGFRRQGQFSLYWGADRVFQFDESQQLRRVYLDGRKYAAESGELIELTRPTRGGRVELTRQGVDESTTSTIVDTISGTLSRLSAIISDKESEWSTVGASDADFHDRVIGWLQTIPSPLQIGSKANA